MILLQIILRLIHLISDTLYYILLICVSIGRVAFEVLTCIYTTVADILTFIAIVLDELHLWICELANSFFNAAYDVKETSNNGFNAIVDGIYIVFSNLGSFLTSTRLRTRLLTTYIGQSIANFFTLIHNALVLIADTACWLVMIVPRLVCTILFAIGDAIVFIVYGASKIFYNVAHALIDDIFRLTIGIFILFMLVRFRIFLFNALGRCLLKMIQCIGRMKNTLKGLLELRLRDNRQINGIRYNAESVNKLPFSHSCLICRERAKTILLMPCRHLCYCEECSEGIGEIQFSCPLCRNAITSMLNIYI